MESHYQVIMETTVESAFNIHINDHTIVILLKFGPELHYFDTAESNKSPAKSYSVLSTIKDNKSYFSWHEIEGADRARDLQGKIGWNFYNTTEILLPTIK